MAVPAALPHWTVEQYLALERASDTRHEYFDGIVYAMAGGTELHSAIAAALGGLLFVALRGGPCRVYTSDLKMRVSATRYFYPDASVGRGPEAPSADADWLANPRLVAEVLSESTAAYDRGDKLIAYQGLPSLTAILLVETGERRVDVYRRDEGGRWTAQRFGPGEAFRLPDLGVAMAIDDIYAGVVID
jgi:Uma2 family endonuclease